MSTMPWMICLLLLLATSAHAQTYLGVSGNEFRLNGEKVFLSGMNIAWHHYGMDFGNGRYSCCTGGQLEDYLRRISAEGGNSIRIWLHCVGDTTPRFNGDGFVTSTDDSNTMISDLSRFLDRAREYNILVFIVLWNGAQLPSENLKNLQWDDSKLESYINNALRPMVGALKNKVALGGWEVMNEPEGSVYNGEFDSNDCFNTQVLQGSGAGWTGGDIPMRRILRFVNKQCAAIKEEDPKTLCTVGSWSEKTQTDVFSNTRDYYKDSCLIAAGGESRGTIDFYQMHTYATASGNTFNPTSPLIRPNEDFRIDKPNVIGEFSQDGGDGRDITQYMNWAYYYRYSGAWTWQANGGGFHSDDFDTQARGTRWLRGRNDQSAGGRVDINI